MSSIWDGDTLADAIANELINKGFPFGIGLPYAALHATARYLCDDEFAAIVASHVGMDSVVVREVLMAAAEQIEEEVS